MNQIPRRISHLNDVWKIVFLLNCYENGCGSLEEDLERKEMLCILHKALQSIPAEEQEFIRELFFLHRTTRELAQKYGVSQPAIVKRKQRVLSTLKKYFENF